MIFFFLGILVWSIAILNKELLPMMCLKEGEGRKLVLEKQGF